MAHFWNLREYPAIQEKLSLPSSLRAAERTRLPSLEEAGMSDVGTSMGATAAVAVAVRVERRAMEWNIFGCMDEDSAGDKNYEY